MHKNTIGKGLIYWNRRLHIHVGLFLLLFIWLFSFSGLLLNHSDWKFASFWDERSEQKITTPVTIAPGLDSAGVMHSVIGQLGVKGEVSEVKMDQDSVDFRIEVPGHIRNIHVDFKKGLCTQNEIRFNAWGIMRTMHTFNGVNKNAPSQPSSWMLTAIWRFTMDVVAVGLIFLCISSFIMWYRLNKGRWLGVALLIAGFASAVYLVFLLKLM